MFAIPRGTPSSCLGASLGTTANIIRCEEGESIVERSAEYDATAEGLQMRNEKSGLNFYANSLTTTTTTTTDEVGIKSGEEREREGETAPWATEERGEGCPLSGGDMIILVGNTS